MKSTSNRHIRDTINEFLAIKGVTEIVDWEYLELEFIQYCDDCFVGGFKLLIEGYGFSEHTILSTLKSVTKETLDCTEAVAVKVDYKESSLRTKYDKWCRRTQEKGYTPGLSIDQYSTLMRETTCYYSGKPFVDRKGHRLSRTLERKNPRKGYTLDNVVVVTLECNSVKSALDEFIKNPLIGDASKRKMIDGLLETSNLFHNLAKEFSYT